MSACYPLSFCIEWQFTETGELDARLRAAKAAGFERAEFHLWRDKPVEMLAKAGPHTSILLRSRRFQGSQNSIFGFLPSSKSGATTRRKISS